ncbi:MAG: hypothetical protein A2W19_15460 [Spirochaetes bacterium RBG_16_49_21]|nr:MAG: hypothetical protein A2W19_15460 [Spirochaetes bacterium RBG_16_49_21]
MIATVAPGDPSAALSFRGTTAANLPAGETVSVPVIMGLNETKLIAPDYNNERIVILNSITGPYTSRDGDGLGLSSTMSPYDLDFDSRGRIYIADSNYRIIRVDSLNGGNLTYFSLGGEYTPIAVAVDRNNNIVYASSYSQLWKGPLNGSLSSLDPDSLYSIYGMDVGSDGMLYIAGARSTDSTEGIYKYDPTEQRVVGQYTSGGDVGTIYDVQVKFPFIFALNPSPPSENQNYRILQLQIGQNNTIDLVGHGLDTGIGTLNNAGHFTAIINSGLLIMESYPNQLIFIQDVNGTGWQVNTGSGEFDFYDYAEGG